MTNIVDARGLACPLPVVNTKKAIEGMKAGDTVEVLVDNEIAVQNLGKFAKQKAYKMSAEKKSEKEYKVTITLVEGGPEPLQDDAVCATDARQKGMLVVLSSNTMGTGDEKLGKSLMKAFVFAITRQDVLPEQILMYNTGAYLGTEGSDSLEDLKYLEAQGVKIETCGTCLNFYGLTEKLKVGTITNMYDIVEQMEKADKIIRP